MTTYGIDDLRACVQWANNQYEDFWTPDGKSPEPSAERILRAWTACLADGVDVVEHSHNALTTIGKHTKGDHIHCLKCHDINA